MAEQELRQAVPGPGAVGHGVVAGPAQVPHGLLGHGGDPDGGELAGTVQPRQAPGVAAVGLDALTGRLRDEGWGDDLAAHPDRGEEPVQLVAGWARLVAGPEPSGVAEPGDEAAHRCLVVEDPLDVGGVGSGMQEGHRDGVLVDVKSEVDVTCRARDTCHGRLLSVCGSVRSSWWMTHALMRNGPAVPW